MSIYTKIVMGYNFLDFSLLSIPRTQVFSTLPRIITLVDQDHKPRASKVIFFEKLVKGNPYQWIKPKDIIIL